MCIVDEWIVAYHGYGGEGFCITLISLIGDMPCLIDANAANAQGGAQPGLDFNAGAQGGNQQAGDNVTDVDFEEVK